MARRPGLTTGMSSGNACSKCRGASSAARKALQPYLLMTRSLYRCDVPDMMYTLTIRTHPSLVYVLERENLSKLQWNIEDSKREKDASRAFKRVDAVS